MWPILFGIACGIAYILIMRRFQKKKKELTSEKEKAEIYLEYLQSEVDFLEDLEKTDKAFADYKTSFMEQYKAYKETHPVQEDEYHVIELHERQIGFRKLFISELEKLQERIDKDAEQSASKFKEHYKKMKEEGFDDPEIEEFWREHGLID